MLDVEWPCQDLYLQILRLHLWTHRQKQAINQHLRFSPSENPEVKFPWPTERSHEFANPPTWVESLALRLSLSFRWFGCWVGPQWLLETFSTNDLWCCSFHCRWPSRVRKSSEDISQGACSAWPQPCDPSGQWTCHIVGDHKDEEGQKVSYQRICCCCGCPWPFTCFVML